MTATLKISSDLICGSEHPTRAGVYCTFARGHARLRRVTTATPNAKWPATHCDHANNPLSIEWNEDERSVSGRCFAPHPRLPGVHCSRPKHGNDVLHRGRNYVWQDDTRIHERRGLAILMGTAKGEQAGAAFANLAAYLNSYAEGLASSLQVAGFGASELREQVKPEPEPGPEPRSEPTVDLLLDRHGHGWFPVSREADAWSRTSWQDDSNRITVSRRDLEVTAGPVIEYTRIQP